MTVHEIKAHKSSSLKCFGQREAIRMNALKYETVITAICVNGHENKIHPEALNLAWFFKCEVCGTIYVRSSKASTQEREANHE